MTTTYSDCIAVARAELQAAKRLLDDEIQAYSPQSSACDEDYNQLVCERRRVSRLLNEFADIDHLPTSRVT